jgi:hypothetical protein
MFIFNSKMFYCLNSKYTFKQRDWTKGKAEFEHHYLLQLRGGGGVAFLTIMDRDSEAQWTYIVYMWTVHQVQIKN